MVKSKGKNTKQSPQEKQHNEFARKFIFNDFLNSNYDAVRDKRTTGKRVENNVLLFDKDTFQFSASGITIHPEFLPYFFSVKGGCPQKLLLFLLYHVVDVKTCRFQFDEYVIQHFIDYCKAINSKSIYKVTVVKQAIEDLKKANLVLSIKRMQYMINPIIVSTNRYTHLQLINTYMDELIAKKKDINSKFFPLYGN